MKVDFERKQGRVQVITLAAGERDERMVQVGQAGLLAHMCEGRWQ